MGICYISIGSPWIYLNTGSSIIFLSLETTQSSRVNLCVALEEEVEMTDIHQLKSFCPGESHMIVNHCKERNWRGVSLSESLHNMCISLFASLSCTVAHSHRVLKMGVLE